MLNLKKISEFIGNAIGLALGLLVFTAIVGLTIYTAKLVFNLVLTQNLCLS